MTVAPWFRWATITLAVAIGGYAAVQVATWPPVASMAGTNPARTAFIDRYQATQKAAGKNAAVAWTWVPLNRISIHLQRAVVVAEDIGFFSHHGKQAIVWGAIYTSVVVTVVLLFIGHTVFGRLERAVLKEI